jgi:hypothetical protein
MDQDRVVKLEKIEDEDNAESDHAYAKQIEHRKGFEQFAPWLCLPQECEIVVAREDEQSYKRYGC